MSIIVSCRLLSILLEYTNGLKREPNTYKNELFHGYSNAIELFISILLQLYKFTYTLQNTSFIENYTNLKLILNFNLVDISYW